MSIRAKHVHFKNWAAVCNAFVEDSATGDEVVDMNAGHAALMGNNNKYYYYLCYVKSAMRLYTHGQVYDCSNYDDSKLWEEIDDLIAEIEKKQDKLKCSGEDQNIKTINGECILIVDPDITNIETPDTKVTSADNHYTPITTNTETGFTTEISYDSKGHITDIKTRSLTSSDIPDIDASKITSGTISIDRLPHGALERLYVIDNRTTAMEIEEISEGDTIMLTEEESLMFFCVNKQANTFEDRFKGYTAGAATAVNWSGVINKPDGIDNWGSRISVVENNINNYLPLSGGTVNGNVTIGGTTTTNITPGNLNVYNTTSSWSTMIESEKSALRIGHADGYGMIIASTMDSTSSNYIFRVWQGSLRASSGTGNVIFDVKANGNVAIGGDSATEKLTVHGNILFEGNSVLKSSLIGEVLYMGSKYIVLGGGATAKDISTYIDGKNVFIRAGNYNARFSNDGNLVWNGNVAIGKDTASTKLDVYTASGWTSTFFTPKTNIELGSADGYGLAIHSLATASENKYLLRLWRGSLNGASGTGNELFSVNSNGTTTVGGTLYVGTSSDSHIYLKRNGINYIDANGSLRFTVNGYSTNAMEITTSGNVAIGGASGSEKLHVNGNILATGTVSSAGGKFNGNVSITEGWNIMMRSDNQDYLSGIGYDIKGNECLALWAKNSVTRLRWSAGIDLSAGVGVGGMMDITPDFEISKASGEAIGYIAGNTILHSGNYSSYALPLAGGKMTNNARIYPATDALYIGRADNVGYVFMADMCSQNGSNAWYIHTKGEAKFKSTITASNFITSSDKRLKKNIQIISSEKLSNSLNLNFVEFDYKNIDNHSAGHIAQEVKEILPEFVHGNESETEHLSIDYTGLHSVQIKALVDEINSLKKENDALRKTNKELNSRVYKIEELIVMLK